MVKKVECSLTVNESDVRLQFHDRRLRRIYLMSNKVVEMKENELLKIDRLCEYTSIVLLKNHQLFRIPIVRNSWKYRGQQESILSFDIDRECVIMREDLGSFYVKKRQKRKRKKQPNE